MEMLIPKGKTFYEVTNRQIKPEVHAEVVAKMEAWKGYYCLLTDQERAVALAHGYNIDCTNCAAKEQCCTF